MVLVRGDRTDESCFRPLGRHFILTGGFTHWISHTHSDLYIKELAAVKVYFGSQTLWCIPGLYPQDGQGLYSRVDEVVSQIRNVLCIIVTITNLRRY